MKPWPLSEALPTMEQHTVSIEPGKDTGFFPRIAHISRKYRQAAGYANRGGITAAPGSGNTRIPGENG